MIHVKVGDIVVAKKNILTSYSTKPMGRYREFHSQLVDHDREVGYFTVSKVIGESGHFMLAEIADDTYGGFIPHEFNWEIRNDLKTHFDDKLFEV